MIKHPLGRDTADILTIKFITNNEIDIEIHLINKNSICQCNAFKTELVSSSG